MDTLVVNVKDHGVVGDGAADDTAAIQETITRSKPGDTIFFPGGSVYLISAPIRLLADRAYVGGGWHLSASGAVIKQKSGANIRSSGASAVTGLFVDDGWFTNKAFSSNPISVENLSFDGNHVENQTSTACGIVIYGYWSDVTRCKFRYIPLDGIHLTDTAQDNATHSGTNSENRFCQNKISDVGRHGIYSRNSLNNTNQDGYCEGNLIDRVGGDGIRLDRISGWYFLRNHLYGIGQNGIHGANAFATVLESNEVEDFGNVNAPGQTYKGIAIVQLNARGSIIRGNFVGCREPAGSARFEYVSVTGSWAEKDAHVIVTDNLIKGSGGKNGVALAFGADNGAVMHAVVDGNRVSGVHTEKSHQAGVVYSSRTIGVLDADYVNVRGHISSSGGAQAAITRGAAAASVGALPDRHGSSDAAGCLIVRTPVSPKPGVLAHVKFGWAYNATPGFISVQGGSAAAAACLPYPGKVTRSGFAICASVAPPAKTDLPFSYFVAE